tara:strand:+ start:251 stop:571 length:321 start_codon:yes stop_codon:yes gene_type:complete
VELTEDQSYYAVIFTSIQSKNTSGYAEMASKMEALAQKQPGYLGMEHARSELGITISYWKTEAAIAGWKNQVDHLVAQKTGKAKWYSKYSVRVCKVEREYHFNTEN